MATLFKLEKIYKFKNVFPNNVNSFKDIHLYKHMTHPKKKFLMFKKPSYLYIEQGKLAINMFNINRNSNQEQNIIEHNIFAEKERVYETHEDHDLITIDEPYFIKFYPYTFFSI
jgi:hypothetical protein